MFIQPEYPSWQAFMNHQMYHLINPASLGSNESRHNCLRADNYLGRFVNPEASLTRTRDVTNRLLVTISVASFAVSAFSYYFGTDIGLVVAPIAVTTAMIGFKVIESSYPNEVHYLRIRNQAKDVVQRSLSERIQLMIKYIGLGQRDDCRKLAEMKVVELKQNLMKMTRYGDKVADCLDVDNDLEKLIEMAKKYSK